MPQQVTMKRSKTDELHKSFDSKPNKAYKLVDGVKQSTDLKPLLDLLKTDVQKVTDIAEWLIDNELLKDYQAYKNTSGKYNGKSKTTMNSGIARALNVRVPFNIIEPRKTGSSRLEELVQDRVISEIKSWLERYEACNNSSSKWVSSGWKRTMNPMRPTNLTPRLNLGAANSQYSYINNDPFSDGFIELFLVANQEWYVLELPFDRKRFNGALTLTKPTLRIDINGELTFSFTAVYEYNYSPISPDYIIGVDVGITNYVTASVYDVKSNRIIESSTLSPRVHSLVNSIKATNRQVSALQCKGRSIEAGLHRRANINKKKELAIIAAQELADLAFTYDNSVIVFEDLSWVRNTMANGRWNRGELVKWAKHYAELNGSRVFKINPSMTSQWCYLCPPGQKVLFLDYHTIVYPSCGVVEDRDVNATGNIAKRFAGTLSKVVITRSKSRKFTNKTVRRSPVKHDFLKYPGVYNGHKHAGKDRSKNQPTPKNIVRKFDSKRFVGEVLGNNKFGSTTGSMAGTVLVDACGKVSAAGRTLEKQPELNLVSPNYRVYDHYRV